jgi:peptide/nickel transport system substrate-binding protein
MIGLVLILSLMIMSLNFAAAASKDTLVVGYPHKFGTLDIYKTTQRMVINTGYLLWDPLVMRDPQTSKIVPHLAESWKIIDPTTWEFKLVAGVKFHDGNRLTAEAVRFTIMERILNPEQKSPQAGNYKWIKEVKVIDDATFRIVTEKPYPLVLERLYVLFVYDPKESKEKGDAWLAENSSGSGPYKLVKWDRAGQLIMTANPNYWKKDVPVIKNLALKNIPETSTRIAELIAGGIDVATDLDVDQWDIISRAKGVKALDIPILRVNYWQFDSMGRASKTPLMDKRVRQAISHAVDRQAIIKNVMKGLADPLDSPTNPHHFGHEPNVKAYEYNPQKARALLKEAGYEKGFAADIWIDAGYQYYSNQAADGFLNQVGIKLNMKDYRGNAAQLITLRGAGKVTGIGNYNWGSFNIFDSDAILAAWFLKDSPMCYTNDEQLDQWLTEARFSVDPAKRKALYSQAQKRIIEEAYWMPFFVVHQVYGTNDRLNLVVGPDEVPRFQFASWK